MLVLDGAAVHEAFPMRDAVPLMAEAMRRFSRGDVTQPLRMVLQPPDDAGLVAVMPCHVAGAGYGLKVIVLKPGNASRGLPAHVGALLVLDPKTGYPLAVLDAAAVTAVRTAAVSAVATAALALEDAGDLAILGSGVQARSHLEAMSLVRKLRRVRVWSRTDDRAAHFRRWAHGALNLDVELVPTVAAALADADIVCTTTSATQPVVQASYLREGAHLNAVGASLPGKRELESSVVARCAVFVDSRKSATRESDDLRIPLADGSVGKDHVRAELGEVLLGIHPGRTGEREITMFKSLGLAVQDVMSGFAVASVARARGIGSQVRWNP